MRVASSSLAFAFNARDADGVGAEPMLKSATPFLISYSAEQTGHPSVPSTMNRLVTFRNDATSHESWWSLTQRSKSIISMNTALLRREAR